MPHHVSDADIIDRVLAGDVDVFETLVDRYTPAVWRIVAAKVPRQEAPEVVHDVFVRAWRSLPGFSGRHPFANWLSRIAVRTCHDFWRERYRRREVTVGSLSDDTRDWLAGVSSEDGLAGGNPPPDPADRFEARELLDWLLNQLSADDRMVLTLTYLEGLSGREAADMLGWSTAKVKVRSHRARVKLSRLVEQAGLNTGGSR